MSILEIKNLKYAYSRDSIVFKNINVNLEEGKVYSILGHSGSGKTTFLSLLGGLDTPTEGEILFKGENIENYGLAVSSSKFPVGSSASKTGASEANALAIATLCCCPPDNLKIFLFISLSVRPTFSKIGFGGNFEAIDTFSIGFR